MGVLRVSIGFFRVGLKGFCGEVDVVVMVCVSY